MNTTLFNSVPDGNIVGYAYSYPGIVGSPGNLTQDVGAVAANTTYTLRVDLGLSRVQTEAYLGALQFLVGGTPVIPAYSGGVAPTPGNWLTFTLIYVASPADAGKTLTIELLTVSNGPGYPTNSYFDNVRLDASPTASGTALQFVPLNPCRLVDTRNPNGSFGGPELTAGIARSFNLPQGSCGVPSTALAYSLNVTVVPDSGLGYLSIWPAGQSQPLVSALNSDGRVKANAAIVSAGTSGGVSVYVSDSTHVILDINGYFVAAGTASALSFYPLTPCRIADTRNADSSLGGPFLAGGTARSFPILAGGCGIPSTAQAYSLNFTAVPHQPIRYLATWPSSESQPVVSTLNTSTDAVTANAAIVPAGSGAISVFASDDTDLIIDTNGYFAAPAAGGLSLYSVTPCRVLDTRNPSGAAPISGQVTVNFSGSTCSLPEFSLAYVVNATVVPKSMLGYLSMWPNEQSQPLVSTLNASDGAVTSNMAIVPASSGSIDAFASSATHLILDVSSYFAP